MHTYVCIDTRMHLIAFVTGKNRRYACCIPSGLSLSPIVDTYVQFLPRAHT